MDSHLKDGDALELYIYRLYAIQPEQNPLQKEPKKTQLRENSQHAK